MLESICRHCKETLLDNWKWYNNENCPFQYWTGQILWKNLKLKEELNRLKIREINESETTNSAWNIFLNISSVFLLFMRIIDSAVSSLTISFRVAISFGFLIFLKINSTLCPSGICLANVFALRCTLLRPFQAFFSLHVTRFWVWESISSNSMFFDFFLFRGFLRDSFLQGNGMIYFF